jgi:hypothetical protein
MKHAARVLLQDGCDRRLSVGGQWSVVSGQLSVALFNASHNFSLITATVH